MEYPYISMIKIHNKQIILEGCCENNNFKVIASPDYLFDDYKFTINYSQSNKRIKLYSFFTIFDSDLDIPKELFIKIYVKLCQKL